MNKLQRAETSIFYCMSILIYCQLQNTDYVFWDKRVNEASNVCLTWHDSSPPSSVLEVLGLKPFSSSVNFILCLWQSQNFVIVWSTPLPAADFFVLQSPQRSGSSTNCNRRHHERQKFEAWDLTNTNVEHLPVMPVSCSFCQVLWCLRVSVQLKHSIIFTCIRYKARLLS